MFHVGERTDIHVALTFHPVSFESASVAVRQFGVKVPSQANRGLRMGGLEADPGVTK